MRRSWYATWELRLPWMSWNLWKFRINFFVYKIQKDLQTHPFSDLFQTRTVLSREPDRIKSSLLATALTSPECPFSSWLSLNSSIFGNCVPIFRLYASHDAVKSISVMKMRIGEELCCICEVYWLLIVFILSFWELNLLIELYFLHKM